MIADLFRRLSTSLGAGDIVTRLMPRPPAELSARYKKTLELAAYGSRLRLHAAHDLFSSFDVDAGTRLLLRTVHESEEALAAERVLDLGSGYGPLGLMLRSWREDRVVHLVDRDLAAVEYAAWNAEENRLHGVTAYASLGYDDVRESGFDLILSNVPAKAGPAVIAGILCDAGFFQPPGGIVGAVVIDRIKELAGRLIEDAGAQILRQRTGQGYTAWLYRLPARSGEPYVSAFERGMYDRGELDAELGRERLRAKTYWGLPEFDTLGFGTQVAASGLGQLRGPVESALVFEPGQGHLAAHIARTIGPSRLDLQSRDVLALRAAAGNVELNAAGPVEVGTLNTLLPVGIENGYDLAATVLADRSLPAIDAEIVTGLQAATRPGGTVLVAGSSTAVTRCLERTGAGVRKRWRSRGFSGVLLGPR
jgi:16S rRNA (guanine1207-N2)-methyltransferase